MRSGLRALWTKYPVKYQVLQEARRKSQSPNKKLKWEFCCKECNNWFPQKQVSVDHIISAGSLNDFSDLPGFVERLLCKKEGLQVLCDTCHQKKTNEERELIKLQKGK